MPSVELAAYPGGGCVIGNGERTHLLTFARKSNRWKRTLNSSLSELNACIIKCLWTFFFMDRVIGDNDDDGGGVILNFDACVCDIYAYYI